MWKPNQTGSQSRPYPSLPSGSAAFIYAFEAPPVLRPAAVSRRAGHDRKGLFVKGEITVRIALYQGRSEGSINLPGNRVTSGATGRWPPASLHAKS